MLFKSTILAAALALTSTSSIVNAAECLAEAPATVYEATELSPQNLDYDAVNNMFVAHAGWYNDALVHYYKFRIFAPGTYPGRIVPGEATVADVPIQKLYLVTTTGDFDGVIGSPIIEYHTADGNLYSDFMEIHFVTAPAEYVADTYTRVKDIETSGATVTSANIIVNMPVVPTNSYLQHPETKGTDRAPIQPVPVWYNCVQVWTYVFEVTDQLAADHFAYTRDVMDEDGDQVAIETQAKGLTGFEISVTPSMGNAEADRLSAIPIWHINQYQRGVMDGMGGGPDPNGMRNIINLDRPDAGYSPLWQAFWGTNLPINYKADQASSNTVMTTDNGFDFFVAPMYINCPNIGKVDTTVLNDKRQTEFEQAINVVDDEDSFFLLGTSASLIFQNEMPITFLTGEGVEIGSTTTNLMGAYEYELMAQDIPSGTEKIKVMFKDELIRTVEVKGLDDSSTDYDSSATTVAAGSLLVGAAIAVAMVI